MANIKNKTPASSSMPGPAATSTPKLSIKAQRGRRRRAVKKSSATDPFAPRFRLRRREFERTPQIASILHSIHLIQEVCCYLDDTIRRAERDHEHRHQARSFCGTTDVNMAAATKIMAEIAARKKTVTTPPAEEATTTKMAKTTDPGHRFLTKAPRKVGRPKKRLADFFAKKAAAARVERSVHTDADATNDEVLEFYNTESNSFKNGQMLTGDQDNILPFDTQPMEEDATSETLSSEPLDMPTLLQD